jgi:hypothetical protein
LVRRASVGSVARWGKACEGGDEPGREAQRYELSLVIQYSEVRR